MTGLIQALLGVVVLTTGRKLFWLFVGAVGFVVGIAVAQRFFGDQSELVLLGIALVMGILGTLLAVFLQRLAVGLAGFVAGGYALMVLIKALDLRFGTDGLWFLVGGFIGAVLVVALFDWALIILSSLGGAGMVVGAAIDAFDLSNLWSLFLLVILFIIGITVQLGFKRREPPKQNTPPTSAAPKPA